MRGGHRRNHPLSTENFDLGSDRKDSFVKQVDPADSTSYAMIS